MLGAALASCTVRQDKYADSLRIGTTALPKNLNPYSSTASSSTFFVGMFYNTILNSDSPPAGYVEGETYTFPDGTVYTPIDTASNPLAFTDGLLKYEGALPKQEGSVYGYEYFDPTEEQYALCRQVQAYVADLAIEIPLFAENTITFYTDKKWKGWIEMEGSSIWNSYSIRFLSEVTE